MTGFSIPEDVGVALHQWLEEEAAKMNDLRAEKLGESGEHLVDGPLSGQWIEGYEDAREVYFGDPERPSEAVVYRRDAEGRLTFVSAFAGMG